MLGSKQAVVQLVTELRRSFSDQPSASLAAMYASGYPVALLASAELRESRAFTSMM